MEGPSALSLRAVAHILFPLSIFSLKRLNFGAQVDLPSATWSTSGSRQLLRHCACDQRLPHHLPKRHRYCSF